jgi:hypothetical protein
MDFHALQLVECVLIKYKSFVVKTRDDLIGNAIAKNNYKLLCNCDTILGLN